MKNLFKFAFAAAFVTLFAVACGNKTEHTDAAATDSTAAATEAPAEAPAAEAPAAH